MKVIAFNGSARKDGNTAILLNTVLEEIGKEGIETELYQLAGKKIQGCIACYRCMKNRDRRCAVTKDIVNDCIQKMIEADGSSWAPPPTSPTCRPPRAPSSSGRATWPAPTTTCSSARWAPVSSPSAAAGRSTPSTR